MLSTKSIIGFVESFYTSWTWIVLYVTDRRRKLNIMHVFDWLKAAEHTEFWFDFNLFSDKKLHKNHLHILKKNLIKAWKQEAFHFKETNTARQL